eukprot:1149475-Pelagomonas_calceolata.AAC.4
MAGPWLHAGPAHGTQKHTGSVLLRVLHVCGAAWLGRGHMPYCATRAKGGRMAWQHIEHPGPWPCAGPVCVVHKRRVLLCCHAMWPPCC